MEREYPQKVMAIYEAVGRLIAAGKDTANLKVSDITREAGIGKGTAYEYFDSKEEIIGRAVCYQMQGMMQRALKKLASIQSLQGQLEQIAAWTNGGAAAAMVYGFLKLQVKESENVTDMQQKISEMTVGRDKFFEQIADIILQAAVRDGVIGEPEDWNYARMVVTAAIMMMMEMCISKAKGGSCRNMTSQMILDYTMRVITKALN